MSFSIFLLLRSGLDIKDIVWPGQRHAPPEGVPDKFHMRITFLEEPPFVIVSEPDPVSAKCSINRGVPCLVPKEEDDDYDYDSSGNATEQYDSKCCSGMCVDLLRKFEDELKFTYELVRVRDPKFGTLEVSQLSRVHTPLNCTKTNFSFCLLISGEKII